MTTTSDRKDSKRYEFILELGQATYEGLVTFVDIQTGESTRDSLCAPSANPSCFSRAQARSKIPNFNLGQDALLDVAITCTTQDKYIFHTTQQQRNAANHYATEVKDSNW